MIVIPNYEIVDKLGESPQATIYKAYHKRNPGRLLALKVLKATFLSDNKKAQLRQKIEQLRVLNDPMVITPIAFDSKDETCFITQAYFDGVTLDKYIEARGQLSLKEFFTIACELARALDKTHEAGIIHGGIKPHNILVNHDTLDIRLIDFVSTLDVRDVSHFIYDHSFIRATLSYTSPEQTGRINHRVVFSSDMYSLGILFYELLTGRLPFSSNDPLEVIHSHLAEEATEVHELNPDVPAVLSKIVVKLMLKEPEKRYQSSNGLLADLVRCRDEYAATGTIGEFPLESHVYTHRVTFISKMVGRDSEAKAILDEYEEVAQGQFRSMFISGLSGIGKTRLIQELQKPIVRHRGYFTSGKFDVYQKNIPYSSLIQALRNLMRTFLTESDERVAAWKSKILRAVEQNGKVLTEVVPELEIIIGPQPPVQVLPPVESLNRFHDVFDRFLTCLAEKENPLVLFIDDLQWCDTASFDFFTNIFANYKEHPYLFFLGAYRHNEVDSSHPLIKLIRSAREGRIPLQEIRLGPLKPEHCHEMVSYILDSPPEQTRTLAEFISNLSEGNPLFVSESLSYLHNEDLVFLDTDRQWRWDMAKIRQSRMPTTVVALFNSKIQKMPIDSISLLEYSACMGNIFSPTELSSIREMPLTEIFEALKPALGLGLLMEYKNQLQFIHDKVQEAALSAIPAEKRRRIHWEVGTHLRSAVPEDISDYEKVENLFSIVAHLNMGREENPDPETSYFLSDLNYHAGNRALNSLATEAANSYFRLSRELLPIDCWKDSRYERTFRIFQSGAKTELMCGKYENSEKLLDQLLEHAKTDLDKAECLAEQTTSLSSIGNFIKAIETANRGLAYFDKAIPEKPDEADRQRKELMSEIAAKNIDVWNTILNMPFTKDRKSKIELKLYSELIPDLYMSGLVPQLYLSAAQSTQHCLAGGMDESVIYSFSIMGLQLGEQEDFEPAIKYEDLARDLSAKYPNTFGATRGMNGIVWCNAHSRSHPRDIVNYSLKGIQCGKNCGDLYNAGLSYGPVMWNLQVQGADMTEVEDYAKECLQFSNRYHLSFSVGLAEAMQAGWIAPMKKGYSPIFMGEKLKQWEKDNHVASAGSYYVHMGLAYYYFGEYEKALEYLDGVRQYLTGLTDNVLKRQWHVFLVLNALKLYERRIRFQTRDELMAEIQPLIKKIEKWAGLGPLLKPYLAFLYAELERVTGNLRDARNLYLDAINVAHGQRYTFLEAHLNESFGELLHQAGVSSAGTYFTEALRLYKKCHAERKEVNLIEKYSEYFEEASAVLATATANAALPELDVAYLMKSALAISAEIEQDALLKKIMNVLIESSGAQHGYLLIEEHGSLFVRAESHVTERQVIQTLNQKLDDAQGICRAIVRYVQRTREKMILRDARQEGIFKDNPEVQEMQLRSVLCFPVVKQWGMIGELYLENRLMDSVFTPEKIQMMELLLSQVAISLENARLVENMKRAKEEWEVTFNTVPDLMMILDTQHRIVRVNKATADRLSLAPEQCTGIHCYEAVHGMPHPPEFCPHTLTCRDNKEHTTDVHEPRLGGDFLVSTTPMLSPDGKLMGSIHVARDITERKKAEDNLKFLERSGELIAETLEYETILARIPSLIVPAIADWCFVDIVAEDGSINLATVHHADPSKVKWAYELRSAYPLDPNAPIGAPAVIKTGKPEIYSDISDSMLRSIAKNDEELRILRSVGYSSIMIVPLKTPKQTHGCITLVSAESSRHFNNSDLMLATDLARKIAVAIENSKLYRYQVKAEEDIKHLNQSLIERATDLEASNKELEAFSYSVSHDLRAPLRHLDGFSRLVLEDYADKLDDEGKGYLQTIRSSSELMGKLIDDLLNLSRISRAEITLQKVDLSGLACEVANELKSTQPERKVDFVITPGLEAYGDSRLLKLVFDNLLGNAFKFTGKRPHAIIQFGLAELTSESEFFVRDNGAGFDMTYADKLFKPFQRLHKADQFPGTGIGLASVQRIMSRLGGKIRAEGEIEKGATFYFTLRRS